jgi:hypothetical protein
VLKTWATHYNHARVHTSLGPGVPDLLRSKAVLGGLHHEYWLDKVAA